MNNYKSFSEFYPFYLKEHQNHNCRLLHFIGTALFIVILMGAFLFHKFNIIWLGPIAGYSFAWIGHYFFEKNKPTTFQYPLYSFLSDFKLFFEIVAGKEKL